MSDVVIRVENLSKKYTIRHQNGKSSNSGDGLRHVISDAVSAPFRALSRQFGDQKSPLTSDLRPPISGDSSEDFYALRDVSFQVKQGEVLGIIGRNGAGKSTLLKILSRITEPTSGRIGIRGRVASLLEVGTGFHPELTGRENIYLNGAILGMTRMEVRRKFEEIAAFAEVTKFLDTPVKRYSSGMYVRLAFAIAAHLDPEILIVDEVLAVGDSEFQKKCLGKLGEIGQQGRTVIFVSHDLRTIRSLCSEGIYVREGEIISQAPIQEILRDYTSLTDKDDLGLPIENDGFMLHRFDITQDNKTSSTLDGSDPFQVYVEFELHRQMTQFRIGIYVKSALGETVTRSFSTDWNPEIETMSMGHYHAKLEIPGSFLMAGNYRIGLHASRYGVQGFVSESSIQREIALLPPDGFNAAHRSETINAVVMLKNGWKIERAETNSSSTPSPRNSGQMGFSGS